MTACGVIAEEILMRTTSLFFVAVLLLIPLLAAAQTGQAPELSGAEKAALEFSRKKTITLPEAAMHMAVDLDAQLARKLGLPEPPARGQAMVLTTPVDLSNLEQTSALARLMGEEMATWFTRFGYSVQEIRKGRALLFNPGEGEMLLTRRTDLVSQKNVQANVVLMGTYTATRRNVRFNLKLVHAPSNDVLAMTSQTLPISREAWELLHPQGYSGLGVTPSVEIRLDLARQF